MTHKGRPNSFNPRIGPTSDSDFRADAQVPQRSSKRACGRRWHKPNEEISPPASNYAQGLKCLSRCLLSQGIKQRPGALF